MRGESYDMLVCSMLFSERALLKERHRQRLAEALETFGVAEGDFWGDVRRHENLHRLACAEEPPF